MENNDCYDPKTRTSKEDKQFKEDLLNVCGNFAKVGLDCIEKQNDELEQLQKEKEQLIDFLEKRISLCDEDIKKFRKNYNVYFSIVGETEMMKKAYQEVLDFANKGGKE